MLETPFLSLYHCQNGTRTSMSPQSMHASRILYWVHTIQTSELFGPTARSAVAPSNALENLFLSLETHIKVLKNGTESNVSESPQDVQISMRFLVIPRESWKLWMNIVFEMPWKNYCWTWTFITGPTNGAWTSMRCHILILLASFAIIVNIKQGLTTLANSEEGERVRGLSPTYPSPWISPCLWVHTVTSSKERQASKFTINTNSIVSCQLTVPKNIPLFSLVRSLVCWLCECLFLSQWE